MVRKLEKIGSTLPTVWSAPLNVSGSQALIYDFSVIATPLNAFCVFSGTTLGLVLQFLRYTWGISGNGVNAPGKGVNPPPWFVAGNTKLYGVG